MPPALMAPDSALCHFRGGQLRCASMNPVAPASAYPWGDMSKEWVPDIKPVAGEYRRTNGDIGSPAPSNTVRFAHPAWGSETSLLSDDAAFARGMEMG